MGSVDDSIKFDDTDPFYLNDSQHNECSWDIGQLAWARMSIYPFWPCIVSEEPRVGGTHQKYQAHGRSKTLMIHVHFFNDHGRHSWIPAQNMIPFLGIEEFRKRAKSINDSFRKKEPKFAAAFNIKPNVFLKWQMAVAEAMDVLYDLDTTTLDDFKLQDKKSLAASENNETGKKRKILDDDGNEVKVKNRKITKKSKNHSNLSNLDTPPISPIEGKMNIDFELFIEKHDLYFDANYPDASKEQKMSHLKSMWDASSDKEKYSKMYCSRLADKKHFFKS